MGRARSRWSSTTTLACGGPPRISPPTSEESMACSPPRVAARASVLAMSWMPCPPIPVMMTSSRTGSSLAARPTILPTNRLLGQQEVQRAGGAEVSGLSIGAIVDACLRARPAGVAATLGGDRYTFAVLDAAANSCAHALRARGVGQGDIVAWRASPHVPDPERVPGVRPARRDLRPAEPRARPGRDRR